MKIIKLFAIIAVLAVLYFGYIRDNYLHYPIQTTLVNNEGIKLPVQLRGRSAQVVQFSKVGSSQTLEYRVQDLDMFTKIKLSFLPKRLARVKSTVIENETTAKMHMEGMQALMGEFNTQMRLLQSEKESKATPRERDQIQFEIDKLDIKIKELKFKMDTFEARSK